MHRVKNGLLITIVFVLGAITHGITAGGQLGYICLHTPEECNKYTILHEKCVRLPQCQCWVPARITWHDPQGRCVQQKEYDTLGEACTVILKLQNQYNRTVQNGAALTHEKSVLKVPTDDQAENL